MIRLGRNLRRTQAREHVEILLRRMAKSLIREQRRTVVDPFRSLLDGAEESTITLADGRCMTFRLKAGTRSRTKEGKDGWEVTVGPQVTQSSLHRWLWNMVSASMLPDVETAVRTINAETLRVRIADVRLRIAKTQWGSCSARGHISINPALLFLPKSVMTYVIVHELAHCVVRGHSAKFWRTVEATLPHYEEAMKMLRTYRLPTI